MARFRLLHPLDRYVLSEFTKIFVATAIGFPVLLTVFDLTDNIDKYLSRNLPRADIALSYLYWIPESMYMVLPAAVLFAAVFSIGGFTRHSEISAAKASGISFHRFTVPIYVASVVVAAMALVLSELAPLGNRRRNELLQEVRYTSGTERFNFAFAAEQGRVYTITQLRAATSLAEQVQIERKGREDDPAYPTWVATARRAQYVPRRGWTLVSGTAHILPAGRTPVTFVFDSLRDRHFTETPIQLMASDKAPEDMRYAELGRYIAALERSGSDVNRLKVDRALKIAVPVTCIIIALFGAPLATSTQRGGAAWGIGLSLAVTVAFLVFIQLTRAIGGKSLMDPELAAWMPNALFGLGGLVLLWRVRT
jgi:lipopolysaccharide export system permease protein